MKDKFLIDGWVYDIEVYPNVFTCAVINLNDDSQDYVFEVSERKNHWEKFVKFLHRTRARKQYWIGFNNFGYDYQVIHQMLDNLTLKARWQDVTLVAYKVSNRIIANSRDENFNGMVWDNAHVVKQIDLMKIHHFDNVAKATSLKVLEFNMRSENIKDLPFPPGTILTAEQIPTLIQYNRHDARETKKFCYHTKKQIEFRFDLTRKYRKNFINSNDTKIGKDFFIMELDKVLGDNFCYTFNNRKREPKQTIRKNIIVENIIFPYIHFQRPEFIAIKNWLSDQVLYATKEVFSKLTIDQIGDELFHYTDLPELIKKFDDRVKKPTDKTAERRKKINTDLNVIVDGFQFCFGTGGLHASIDPSTVYSDKKYVIKDVDVISYYPSLAIQNDLYPKHLTKKFCEIYETLFLMRKSYDRGTPENLMLKLASNATFGNSNNAFSVFRDSQFTMAITINGQLLLCMLAEKLMKIPGLKMIQANTDGVTVLLPRKYEERFEDISIEWEMYTGLELEKAEYNRMFIKDVNNYIAEKSNGELKRKGVYEYEIEWHQNHSALVVPKAMEKALINKKSIEDFIIGHEDNFDFCLRCKVDRNTNLVLRDIESETPMQKVTRYFISDSQEARMLFTIRKPTPKMLVNGKTDLRYNAVHADWSVIECNDMKDFDRSKVCHDFYIQEAEKNTLPLLNIFNDKL